MRPQLPGWWWLFIGALIGVCLVLLVVIVLWTPTTMRCPSGHVGPCVGEAGHWIWER